MTMDLTLYDTSTRQKRRFEPLDPHNVRMYVCGPTVYDFAHIGNARPVIVFDVLYRLLRHVYGAGHVKYVRNITDVDDRINQRAARNFPELPLNEAIRKVTAETERQFHEDVAALGALPPTVEPLNGNPASITPSTCSAGQLPGTLKTSVTIRSRRVISHNADTRRLFDADVFQSETPVLS